MPPISWTCTETERWQIILSGLLPISIPTETLVSIGQNILQARQTCWLSWMGLSRWRLLKTPSGKTQLRTWPTSHWPTRYSGSQNVDFYDCRVFFAPYDARHVLLSDANELFSLATRMYASLMLALILRKQKAPSHPTLASALGEGGGGDFQPSLEPLLWHS